jgi:hypothetical protein
MDLSNSVSDVKRLVFPKPVGYWFITPLFSVEVYDKKPDEMHIKNHKLLLGWEWKDADDISNVHETDTASRGGIG